MRSVLILSLLLMPRAASAQVVVAVADFEVQNAKELAPLGKGLAQMLITDLSVSESIRIVERSQLRELVKEIELQSTAYFDPKNAAKLGKGLGAELIVTGQVFAAGSGLRLDVRAVDVETSEVLYTGKVEGKREAIFELQKKLASGVLDGLGAKLTPIGKKQIGKRGTKSFEALARFGSALDAEDRGKGDELRAQLIAALKADPEFLAAKDRLAALEERVGTLERSGGLILKPASWRDHLHNFKLHREKADLVQAERSLVNAIELEPRRAELWTSYHDLPVARRKEAVAKSTLDAPSKAALAAHLAQDPAAFRASKESVENPAFRPVLAIDLIGRRLTAPSLTAAIELERAAKYVLDPKNRRHVEPMLIDSGSFFAQAEKLKKERLDGRDPPGRWLEQMAASPPGHGDGGASSAWQIMLMLAERPAGPIEVRISKVPLPPGEKPYPNEGLWDSEHAKQDDPAREKAVRSQKAYGWYVNPGTNPFARGGIKGFAKFGDSFSIPKQDQFVECEAATRSPSGESCTVLFTLQKHSVTPGPYELEVRYLDGAGFEVRHRDARFWLWENRLAEFQTGLWRHSDPRFMINPVDERVRARMDPKLSMLPMVARACANPPISDKPAPLESFHYDTDLKLVGGKTIEIQDVAEWKKYRAAILERGLSTSKHDEDGCAYLPLPKLEPGRHHICVVAKRTNGSMTLEPECFEAEVPKSYPQEGRKPR